MNLSRIVSDVQSGTRVFLTNHGKRVVEIIPAVQEPSTTEMRGLGLFKDKIKLPLGWGTQEARRKATAEVLKLMDNE